MMIMNWTIHGRKNHSQGILPIGQARLHGFQLVNLIRSFAITISSAHSVLYLSVSRQSEGDGV